MSCALQDIFYFYDDQVSLQRGSLLVKFRYYYHIINL